jgi:hypothetical protein
LLLLLGVTHHVRRNWNGYVHELLARQNLLLYSIMEQRENGYSFDEVKKMLIAEEERVKMLVLTLNLNLYLDPLGFAGY